MIKIKTPKMSTRNSELKGGGKILAGIISVFFLGGIAYGIKIYYDNMVEEMEHQTKNNS